MTQENNVHFYVKNPIQGKYIIHAGEIPLNTCRIIGQI